MHRAKRSIVALVLVLLATSCVVLGGSARFALPEGHTLRDVVLADLDGNGIQEVVVLTNQAILRVGPCGDSCLETVQSVPLADMPVHVSTLLTGDVDGDGTDDLVVGEGEPFDDIADTIHTFYGSAGEPGRAPGLDPADTTSYSPPADTWFLYLPPIDHNDDGFADMWIAVDFLSAIVFLGDGTGAFATAGAGFFGLAPEWVPYANSWGDVDGLGNLDRASIYCVPNPENTCRVRVETDAGPVLDIDIAPSASGVGIALADHNGDGYDDAMVHQDDPVLGPQIAIHLADGVGGLEAPVTRTVERGASSGVDLDGDGFADVTGFDGPNDEFFWRTSNGTTGFEVPFGIQEFRHAIGFDASLQAVGDITGDDLPELVFTDFATNSNEIVVIENASPSSG